ncbi:ShlB/FhaC/HecB family hemolysin secretion/activation protein [Gloeothece verrucosa]|uniref:ShlB/FhaC/HecB family hemolysin secretion/activation protein n=1 Tax=Gloeothece verrucosa TaxID=2546359 RepID=UPI001FDFD17A|nr:ShlB/FhaC/HecB family hemolysin secretion/activation protein [Gloeothece verrucosa]
MSQSPNPIPSSPPQHPSPQPLPEVPPKSPTPTPSSSPYPSNIPGTITVSRFEFEGNTVFSNEELAKITAPFTKRPLTFAQLLQVEAAVTKLYTDAGYINSGAIIPANQILAAQGAIVKIEIIEGGIEEINVTVKGRLNPDYIRSRLKVAASKPLNQNRLLEALQLLQLDPLIKNISAQLSAGSRADLSILTVKVTEADTFNMELYGDNSRIPSVGTFRRGVRLNHQNLIGFGDGLSVEYLNSDGSDNVNLSYIIPVNPRNATVILSGGVTDSKVIEEPFNELNITSDAPYVELSFRQPVIQNPTQELAFGITASRQESRSKIFGVEFPLSPGADERGRTRISTLRLFQEWTQRSRQEVLAARSQFNIGVNAFDSTINDQPPDSEFFDWRIQGQYVRLLAADMLLVLRSDLQLSDSPLVPLEQFPLGGLYSVRGYTQDYLLTDKGFFASAEVRLPILRVESIKGLLQVVSFLDFGVGWNTADNPIPTPDNNTLVGVGLGLRWQMGDKLTLRFDWGIPLTDVDYQKRSLQEQGLYFSVNYNPF